MCGIIASSKKPTKPRQIVAGNSVRCGRCNREILRTNPDTRASQLPVYCRFCRQIETWDIIAPENENLIPDRSLRA